MSKRSASQIPAGLALEVRIALLRRGQSLRAFARDAKFPFMTLHQILTGVRHGPAFGPVMRAVAPLLPAAMRSEVEARLGAAAALMAGDVGGSLKILRNGKQLEAAARVHSEKTLRLSARVRPSFKSRRAA